MNFKEKVKTVCAATGKTITNIADDFGIFPSSMSSRLSSGKFSIEERQRIADVLGCKYVCKMCFEDGKEICADSFREIIKFSCAHAGINQSELAVRLGKSRQAISKQIKIGRLKDVEVTGYADCIGCSYVSYFEMPDGKII